MLRRHGLRHALAASDEGKPVTPFERAAALQVQALQQRFAAALRQFDAQMEQQARRLADTRAGGSAGALHTMAALLASLPSALTGAGTATPGGQLAAQWAAETSGAAPSPLLPGAALAAQLAAPITRPATGTAGRAAVAAFSDARLASRAAAMHRMADRKSVV